MTEKKRILVFLAALLVIAQFAYASDAVIAYRSGSGSGTSFPKIKFWNSSGSGSWGSEIELPTAGSPVREAVIKASNISTKLVLVTQSDDGNLDAYVCLANCANASNWVTTNNIGNVWTSAPAIHSRRFDVEFETASGRAMVVYSINSSNTSRDLAYQILPAASTSFSGLTEQYIDDSSGNGGSDLQYSWVSLDRKPTGNEIIAAGFDDTGSDINAWVWNGTAWGNQQELTAAATSTNGLEALAVKYAADGTKGMVIGGTGTIGSVNGQYWNGAAWTTANLGDVNGGGDNADIVWLTLKADPATDDLQAVAVEDDTDLDAYYWNGSTWTITQGIDVTIDSSTTRPADFDWNPTGSTGSLVWDTDGAGTTLSTRTCSPQCTGATSTFSAYTGTGAWLALYRNPTSTDTVKILGARMNSTAALGSFSRNSTNFTNYGSANISANATSTAFESFTIAFQLSNASPGVSTCQNINSSGQYLQIANLVGAPIPTTSVVANACIRIASSNVTYDCNGFNITNNGTGGSTFGIVLNGPGITNITVKNCPGISQYSHGFYVHFSNNSIITNVTSFNNSNLGFTAVSSNNITFTNDTAKDEPEGIDFSGSRNGTISNSNFFNISNTGIMLSANSSGNNVTGNNVSNMSFSGFQINNATNNLLSNNIVTNASVGFLLDFGSSQNTLSLNNATRSTDGFYLGTCSSNALVGNSAFNNTGNGFFLTNCSNTNLTGNAAFNNSAAGINLTSTDGARMAGDHLYKNGMDFYVSASGESYNMSGEIFDNPAGTFASYTNLSINDSVASAYYINWSGNATVTPLPAGHVSFGQKFVNITNLTPSVSIDRLVWNWLDSEPGAVNETSFELWEFDSGGWASRNTTPNTAANTLSLSNESTFSVFALLVSFDTTPPVVTLNSPANNSLVNTSPVNFNFTTVDNQSAVMNCSLFIDGVLNATNSSTLNNTPTIFPVSGITVGSHTWNVTCRDASNNTGASQTFTLFNTAVSSCPVITSNGTYNQVANLVGGSNSVSPPSIGGGFSTVCVKIAASNVTYNCNNFNITNDGTGNRIGVFLNSSLKNISLLNCGVNGYKVDVYVLGTNNSLFMNNSIHNASQDGIFVDSSFNSTFTGNDIFNNSQSGVDASASAGHLFTNNTLRNNTQHGIQITSSPNNTFINNTAADNANDGIHVASSDNNLFENNTLFLNKQDGIQVVTNANNTFRNNRANNNTQHGLHIVGTSNNTFLNNSMAFNSQSGFLSASSVNSSFINNTAHDNGQNGFDFAASDMDSMTNNTAYNNPQNGILLDDSNRTTHFMNHFYNNSADLRMVAIANRIINTTYDIYDRPTDAFGNFTNLSINDAAAGSTFTVTWSPQPATPPSGCPAFAALTTGSKFVNITNVSGSVTIDSIAWSWTAAESAPYNESMFRLARYNGTSWVPVANQTLDTVANNITAANLDRFGVFGILVCNDSISALKLDQTAAQPSPGGIVQFNITLTNTGNTTLNPVRVVDVLPAGLTFSAASPVQNNISGQTVTWNNVSSLAPLGSVTIFVNATVNSGVVNASVPVLNMTNVVNTSGTDPLGFNVTANSSANVTVFYANVSVIKLNQTALQPSPGGIVQFNMTVTNTGNVTLNVSLNDTLPAGLSFLSASPANTTGPNWAFTGLAPGASQVIFLNATVNPGVVNASTPILNLTNCIGANGKPPNGNNVTASSCANVTVYYANVTLVKVDITPLPPSPGGLVQWRLNVSNPGQVTLNPVALTDTLPSGFTFSAASPVPTSVVGPVISWANIGPIAPGASVLVYVNSTVDNSTANGTYTNNANVTGKPPNGSNVTAADSASVGVFAPAVNVIKTYTGSAFQVGQNATFRIFVTNTGAINETITIVDVLPGGEAFVTANVSPTGIAGQTLTWANITVLQPGANYSINYTVFVNTSGLQTNNVTATGKPPNGNNVTDNSSASISFIPIGTPNPHNPSDNGLSVIVETDCSGNTVTVFGNGAVSGALVKVDGDPIGTTNTSGQISFPGCGKSVTVRASKSGYSDDVQNKMLIDCNKCAYECVQDTDCPGEKECVANKCTPVQCSCGVIQNHSCAPYQCCSDSQCPAGLACVGNKCVKKYECAKDSDCKDTQFCDIAKGAAGGVCRDVKGCGIVANHTIATAYQCGGPDCPQCPTGYLCESHLCVLKNITCPQTGFVGTEQICHATANNQSCSLCDLRITTPAGKTYEEKTDGKGNFPLKLDLAGIYSIGIIGSNNTTINSVYLRALEKAAPVEPAKPSILDMCPLPWWLLLLLIIIAVIVYWRSREREEKPLEKKPPAAKPPKGANPKPQA